MKFKNNIALSTVLSVAIFNSAMAYDGTISLTGCTTGQNGSSNVKAFFEPGANTDFNTNKLKNASSDGAQNVQIQLLNNDGTTAIQLGKDFVGQDVHSEAINSDDEATLRYMAQYYATVKAIVGDVISSVNYTIAYE
ncbi:F17 fimbrial protein [Proteus mirabilis]